MAEEVTLNYAKVEWTYNELDRSSEDSFDFTGVGEDDAMQGHTLVELLEDPGTRRVDGDHDNWIDILAIDWGSSEPGASAYELKDVMITSYDTHGAVEGERSAGLRSDGELVQAVSDADMSGDFIL